MSETKEPSIDNISGGGGDSSSTAVKPKTTTTTSEVGNEFKENRPRANSANKRPPNFRGGASQQHPRRGSSSNDWRAANPYRPRAKGQRHFSVGGADFEGGGGGGGDVGGGQKAQEKQPELPPDWNRRRHSTGGKNKKKPGGESGGIGNSAAKGPRLSSGRYRSSLSESQQNGSGEFDYYTDEFELEEPFSESDEEEHEARRKRQAKPQLLLPMPRRRIRTLSGTIPAVGYAPVWGGPTMCLNCLEFFDLPTQTSAYVEHLLEKHKIVIADIELIVDLKRYIEHWRHRFGQVPIEKIFPLVTPNESDPVHGKVDQYYSMSEVIPEDLQQRERLALRRLEEVLQCQHREREDRTFRRQCLFCRYRSTGNRAKLIHHLYTVHHLNLGSPDNLVFINEYIDVLEGKMTNNQCIYCEQIFADHQTLTEHMKKKGHREVNPKNHYYDKFYVINYLELGKRWLEVLAEDFEDNTPTFVDSEEEEEEETWNEWQEDAGEENEINAVCLFCEDTFSECGKFLEHVKEKHKFDLKDTVAKEGLDFYGAVKMINYIRKQSFNLVCFVCDKSDLRPRTALTEHLETDGHVSSTVEKEKWNKDEYLVPTYDNDNLLLFLGEIVEDFAQNDDEEDVFETAFPKVNAKDHHSSMKAAAAFSSAIPVIPEDPPELEETVLNDPELRDQLK